MVKQAFLVDDSKSARIVLSRLLKKNGFDQVDMAASGEDALVQLKQITPDAIFVDFLMDGMDGLETITEIKKDPRFQDTPVVMCTANEGDEYVRAAVEHGALGILAKPPTDQSLGEIISQIDSHQREVAVRSDAVPAAEPQAPAAASPVPPALDEAQLQRILDRFAGEKIAGIAARHAEESTARLLGERVGTAVSGYMDKHLESLVKPLVDQRLAALKPPEIDLEDLQSQVVQQVNTDLEDFVRQLNQRIVEGLIEASIHEQIAELAADFTQRLKETEQRILSQVPEKNEMIEHIRVVTEGSLEAQVRETASQVAQEISNSVATETVETLLDQHLEQQAQIQEEAKSSIGWWIFGILLLAAGAAGAYIYLLA